MPIRDFMSEPSDPYEIGDAFETVGTVVSREEEPWFGVALATYRETVEPGRWSAIGIAESQDDAPTHLLYIREIVR